MTVPRCVLAYNPGPMTLDGTNTWVLAFPDEPALVIDPGPPDARHVLAVKRACPHGIGQIWLTHHHRDHTEVAGDLARESGAQVRAYDEKLCYQAEPLRAGDRIEQGDCAFEIYWLPGHTSDSVGILLTGSDTGPEFFTGDTILGEGTTVIAHPDGDLGRYFNSLEAMQRIVAERQVRRFLPGHGQVITEPGAKLSEYRRHREERLDQVRRVLDEGASGVSEVVDRVYADLPPKLRPAAERSTQAQLDYLQRGEADRS